MATNQSVLQTDLYQLTMSYGYWKKGMAEREAVFHLYFRKAPFGENTAIAAGLESALDWLKEFKFSDDEINYLSTLKGNDGQILFETDYLKYLRDLKLTCEVWAIPEGELVYKNEPILRVQGPLIQCQLLETALLNRINFQTLIATQAARICEAAEDDTVLEFGLRRAQGPDGGLSASRAAYLGGCDATSNVEAGFEYGIPVKGTHAHSWVMSFDDELEAFQSYADVMPNNTVLLVDTYDTAEGVEKALLVAKELRDRGFSFGGVRLDSGDLCALSILARKRLDEEGFTDANVIASNDLDVETIRELKLRGTKIDVWGVGTKLVTAYEQPALGGVYKLAAMKNETGEWDWKVKRSNDRIKVSLPGILQVERKQDGDVIFHDITGQQSGLLELAFENGEVNANFETKNLTKTREQARLNWRNREEAYEVIIDEKLREMQDECLNQAN